MGLLGSLDRFSSDAFDVLGPVASPMPRLKNRYRFQCMIKWRGEIDAIGLVKNMARKMEQDFQGKDLLISLDVDPQMLM